MQGGQANSFEGVSTAADARALTPTPAVVRGLALRADELRFTRPSQSLEVATVALEALEALPERLRRPRLVGLVWSVLGSVFKVEGDLDGAELALRVSGHYVRGDAARLDWLKRLAYLRADQGRRNEALRLVREFTALAGGVSLPDRARALSDAGSILNRFNAFEDAVPCLSFAAAHLRPGDRFHLAAVYNLGYSLLETASSPADFAAAAGHIDAAAAAIDDEDSLPALKLGWLQGNLFARIRGFRGGRQLLEQALERVDARPDPLDQALVRIDLADLEIRCGRPEAARDIARASWSLLQALRNHGEAYRAMRVFLKAAEDLTLDSVVLRTVRRQVVAL